MERVRVYATSTTMKSFLLSYAIENQNFTHIYIYIYILMFCIFLHPFRKSTVDVFKLTGRRPAMNQIDCTAMLQHEKPLYDSVFRSPVWR